VLPELTADDLIGLGVTSIGHRRKLLAAIAALGERPSVAQSAASATPAPTSPPTIDAERRQLTVLFCDLVGSTALSTRHDHSFRPTGITVYLLNGGLLEYAQQMAAHESARTRARPRSTIDATTRSRSIRSSGLCCR
jgi:class 3 adenylate cyclase